MKKNNEPQDFISEEDSALFRQSMRELAKKNLIAKDSTPKKQKSLENQTKEDLFLSRTYLDNAPVWAETVLSYAHASVDSRKLKDLKMGKLGFARTCDLHGLTYEQALQGLEKFIDTCLDKEIYQVLVVHGKGSATPKDPPLLKNMANAFLKMHPAILAFHSALPRHGGNGAVYVLLRKKSTERNINNP